MSRSDPFGPETGTANGPVTGEQTIYVPPVYTATGEAEVPRETSVEPTEPTNE